jgi:hypothetical protein
VGIRTSNTDLLFQGLAALQLLRPEVCLLYLHEAKYLIAVSRYREPLPAVVRSPDGGGAIVGSPLGERGVEDINTWRCGCPTHGKLSPTLDNSSFADVESSQHTILFN